MGTFDGHVIIASNHFFLLVYSKWKISMYPMEAVTQGIDATNEDSLVGKIATSMKHLSLSHYNRPLVPAREISLTDGLMRSGYMDWKQSQVRSWKLVVQLL